MTGRSNFVGFLMLPGRPVGLPNFVRFLMLSGRPVGLPIFARFLMLPDSQRFEKKLLIQIQTSAIEPNGAIPCFFCCSVVCSR